MLPALRKKKQQQKLTIKCSRKLCLEKDVSMVVFSSLIITANECKCSYNLKRANKVII